MTQRFHSCVQQETEKRRKLIQREGFAKMTFIALLTAVVIQKGKFSPAHLLIKEFLCNNDIFWRGIFQPQDIALLSEGGAGSYPETEISSTLSSPLLGPFLWDSLPCENFPRSRRGSPRPAPGSLYSLYWHNLWSLSSTPFKSQWMKSAVQHEYFWLLGDKSPLSLDKNAFRLMIAKEAENFPWKLFPMKCLRAQPSATLITLLMSSEQSSTASKGLTASQRRPSAS